MRASGRVAVLVTVDSEFSALERARLDLGNHAGSVTVLNLARTPVAVGSPAFRELLTSSRLIVGRWLGSRAAYGELLDALAAAARSGGPALLALPGEREPDPLVEATSTVPVGTIRAAHAYFTAGGVGNLTECLKFLLGIEALPVVPIPESGRYRPPGLLSPSASAGRVGILFYRAQYAVGDTAVVDALAGTLARRGLDPVCAFTYSLRDEAAGGGLPATIREHFLDASGQPRVDAIVTTLSFSMAPLADAPFHPKREPTNPYLELLDVPVIQAIISASFREEWVARSAGLEPRDVAMKVVMPEFDGRIIGIPVGFAERRQVPGGEIVESAPDPERIERLGELVERLVRLRRIPNRDRRIAVILSNFPARTARVGNAVGLDTPASVLVLLRALREAGYDTGASLPESGDALIHALVRRLPPDPDEASEAQLETAVGRVRRGELDAHVNALPSSARSKMSRAWGAPPGSAFVLSDGSLAMPGLVFGNVFVGVQPARGFGENPIAIYHDPDLPPTYHYLAFYRWFRDHFRADAVIHLGKHGNLEWLPGKSLALSRDCFPDAVFEGLPLFYPFIINDPGEGTQAKRRTHAVIVDHLIPPMTRAETYGDLMKLEQLTDDFYRYRALDPAKVPAVEAAIWELVKRTRLDEDLRVAARPDDFDALLQKVDGYLCEIGDAQIRDGLHILGQVPEGDQAVNLLSVMLRLPNGSAPSLHAELARALGFSWDQLLADPGARFDGLVPALLRSQLGEVPSHGRLVEAIEALARRLIHRCQATAFDPSRVAEHLSAEMGTRAPGAETALRFACEVLWPALARTGNEVRNLLRGLEGRYVPAGPAGAPTRGNAGVLPTGRNFFTVDINTIPSPAAWEVGGRLGQALLERHRRETGVWPETISMVIWGSPTMRTHGDDIAEALYLLGVRPVWQPESRRVIGLELIPEQELGRPRVDVNIRISGFFRDAFPNLVALLDRAVTLAAGAGGELNPVATHVRRDVEQLVAQGVPRVEAERRAAFRVFGSKPGSYGAGLLQLIDAGNWKSQEDLVEVYLAWGSYAYGERANGVEAREDYARQLARAQVAVQNQDNREHDIFDSDDYFQYHGGLIAAIRQIAGRPPAAYFGDSANPTAPKVRQLAEEVRRVFRSRVVNPKWIASMQRHGYKGAFELAATVDFLFGYDATAKVLEDWMYEEVAAKYVLDSGMREFLTRVNPWALKQMAERLLEAGARGLWQHPDPGTLERLRDAALEGEGAAEGPEP